MVEEEFISFLSDDVQQGGLWPEGDKGNGLIVDLHYETGQKFGKAGLYITDKPTTMAIMTIRPANGAPDHEEITSIGSSALLIPSADRDRLVKAPNSNATGLASGGNWTLAMNHLESVQGKEFMRAVAASAKASLVGKMCEFIRVPQPERGDMNKPAVNNPAAANRPKKKGTILVINKILDGSGAAVAAPAAQQTSAPAAVAAPATVGGVDVEQETANLLITIAAEHAATGGLAVAQLPGILASKIPAGTSPQVRGEMLRKALDATFLKKQLGWKYEGGKLGL